MKFIEDEKNTKKVRIVAETDAERQWLIGKNQRIARTGIKFALRAFREWSANPPTVDVSGLAEAMTRGPGAPQAKPPTQTQREEGHRKMKEVIEWATRLTLDLDYTEGLSGKEQIGPLTSLAFQASQLLRIPGPDLAGVPWPEKAGEILRWAEAA